MNTDLRKPILAVAVCSSLALAMLAARMLLLGSGRHLYLAWNLFLAWLPMLFALLAEWQIRRQRARPWLLAGFCAAWLLFFPNAPYILTDVVHLRPQSFPNYWADLVLILVFALTGLVLGFLSLFMMQRHVAGRAGGAMGWAFVGGVTLLNGFGIYAGRFFRWNSWDVVLSPGGLMEDLTGWMAAVPNSPRASIIPLLFGILMFLAYVLLYSLTHLEHPPRMALVPGGAGTWNEGATTGNSGENREGAD